MLPVAAEACQPSGYASVKPCTGEVNGIHPVGTSIDGTGEADADGEAVAVGAADAGGRGLGRNVSLVAVREEDKSRRHHHGHEGHGGDAGRASESRHLGEPPRDPEIPFLGGRLDGEEDAIERALRGPVGSVLEPVGDGALELSVAHATCPSRLLCLRATFLEGGPQGAGGVVESRTRRPVRDPESLGHRHEGQAHVVMEDEDRALVERQPAERLLQLVACGDAVHSSTSFARSIGMTRTVAAHRRLRGASA